MSPVAKNVKGASCAPPGETDDAFDACRFCMEPLYDYDNDLREEAGAWPACVLRVARGGQWAPRSACAAQLSAAASPLTPPLRRLSQVHLLQRADVALQLEALPR